MKQRLAIYENPRSYFAVTAFMFLSFYCNSSLMAATDTWTGGGAPNGDWSDVSNWGGIVPNMTGDNMIFTGSHQPLTTNDIPVTGAGWVLLNPSVPFTISGHAMNLTLGLTNLAQNNTWNVALTNLANQTIDVEGNSVLTINTNIVDTGTTAFTMTKTGSGTLVLGGTTANTSMQLNLLGGTVVLNKASSSSVYAIGGNGGESITGGLLQFSGTGTNQLPTSGTGNNTCALWVTNGGELDLNGQTEYMYQLNIGGTGINGTCLTNSSGSPATIGFSGGTAMNTESGTVTVGGGGNITITGKGTWLTGTVTKVGANTLTLALGTTANSRNTIALICNGGTVVLAKTGTALSTSPGNGDYAVQNFTVNSGATVQLGGDGSGCEIYDGMSPVVNDGGVLDMNGEPQTFSALAGNIYGLTINGSGNGCGALINSSETAATLINTNGYAVTLGSDSTIGCNGNLTIVGLVIGAGEALTKVGAGTLTFSNELTYSGNTTISGGTLALGGSASFIGGSQIITVASNALLDVSGVSFEPKASETLRGGGSINGNVDANICSIHPGTPAALGTLTFSNNLMVFNTSLATDFGPLGGNSQVSVLGNLTNSGTLTVSLNYRSLAAGTYTLMTYSSLGGGGRHFQLNTNYPNVTLNSPGATALTITVGSGGSSGNTSLIWKGDGAANTWDLSTTNWLDFGSSDVFFQGDTVTFDDTGSSTPAINLMTTLSPASITVNTTTNSYIFSGAGSLAGAASLTKNGTSVLVLATTNSYTGGTIIHDGTVQLGNGGTSGDAGFGTITLNRGFAGSNGANACLAINRTGTTVFANTLSLDGGYIAINYQGIYVNAGQTAIFTNSISGVGQLWVNGPGLLVITNSTQGASYTFSGGVVIANSLGGLSFDSLNELRAGTSIYFAPAGGNLIYTGPSDSDSYLFGSASSQNAIFQGGTNVINIANPSTTLVIDGVMYGSGTFVKSGPGTFELNNTNSYTAATIVSNGVLMVGADGAIGSGQVTVCSNAVLAGAGVVLNNVTVQAGGIVQGGDTNYSGALTLLAGPLNFGPTNGPAVPTYSRFTIAAGGQISTPILNVNGTNTILIQDNALSVGTNTLISYGSINYTAGSRFQLGTLPAGVVANVLDTGSAIQLAVTATNAPSGQTGKGISPTPFITHLIISNGNLSFAATNGVEGNWTLLQSTNLMLPLGQWTTICVVNFDASGTCFTNIPYIETNAQTFYILKQ